MKPHTPNLYPVRALCSFILLAVVLSSASQSARTLPLLVVTNFLHACCRVLITAS
jgi:hypothetical protein